jgi:hypothetical protein
MQKCLILLCYVVEHSRGLAHMLLFYTRLKNVLHKGYLLFQFVSVHANALRALVLFHFGLSSSAYSLCCRDLQSQAKDSKVQ